MCLCCFVFVFLSAVWPFCPFEHLFLHVDFITCNRLSSQINDDDDDHGDDDDDDDAHAEVMNCDIFSAIGSGF